MTPDADTRLADALVRAAAEVLGKDHAICRAEGQVLQAALHQLPQAERDQILSRAHRLMREDIAAIWSFLPGGEAMRTKQ